MQERYNQTKQNPASCNYASRYRFVPGKRVAPTGSMCSQRKFDLED